MKIDLADLSASIAVAERELDNRAGGKLNRYFPATGPYRRALYPKCDPSAPGQHRRQAGERGGDISLIGRRRVSATAPGRLPTAATW